MLGAILHTVEESFTSLLRSVAIVGAWIYGAVVLVEMYLRMKGILQDYFEQPVTKPSTNSPCGCGCSCHVSATLPLSPSPTVTDVTDPPTDETEEET